MTRALMLLALAAACVATSFAAVTSKVEVSTSIRTTLDNFELHTDDARSDSWLSVRRGPGLPFDLANVGGPASQRRLAKALLRHAAVCDSIARKGLR